MKGRGRPASPGSGLSTKCERGASEGLSHSLYRRVLRQMSRGTRDIVHRANHERGRGPNDQSEALSSLLLTSVDT